MKKNPLFLLSIAAFLAPLAAHGASDSAKQERNPGCPAGREFVVAHGYLMERKDLGLSTDNARTIAREVAKGCTNAALRFMRLVNLLTATGVPSPEAVKTGQEFAKRTDAETGAFTLIFEKAFAKDQLDLDTRSSLSLARSLTSEFKGDIEQAKRDFQDIVSFCKNDRTIDLSLTDCGFLAGRVVKAAENFEGGIGRAFARTVDFMRSPSGPGLAPKDALRIAEDLAKQGPASLESFEVMFRYATSKAGLGLSAKDAIALGADLSKK